MDEAEHAVAVELARRLLARAKESAANERRETVLTGFSYAVAGLIADFPQAEREAVAQRFFDHFAERVSLIAKGGHKPN